MDPSSIPKEYGGDLEWRWGDRPLLDDATLAIAPTLETPSEKGTDQHLFIRGPMLFQDGKMEVVTLMRRKGLGNGAKKDIPVDSNRAAGRIIR